MRQPPPDALIGAGRNRGRLRAACHDGKALLSEADGPDYERGQLFGAWLPHARNKPRQF